MRGLPLFLIIFCLLFVPTVHGIEINQVGGFNFGVAYDIVYRDDVAYVSGNNGVEVFDVSDRENPVKLTRIENNNGAFGLELLGELLYIAGTSDGFFIVDVSAPSDPVVLGSLPMTAIDLSVEGDFAYVSSGASYYIIDVSDPENPEEVSTVPGVGRTDHLLVKGDILYLGETLVGLNVYDVSDKAQPLFLRTVPGTVGIFDIEADGSTIYLACHDSGVKILDITNNTSPRVIGSFNNGGEAYGIHVIGNYLLVADLQQGVEILDINDREFPTLMTSWTETHPHGVSGDSEYIYLADQDDGLEIFKYGESVEPPENEVSNQIPVNTLAVTLGILLMILLWRKK